MLQPRSSTLRGQKRCQIVPLCLDGSYALRTPLKPEPQTPTPSASKGCLQSPLRLLNMAMQTMELKTTSDQFVHKPAGNVPQGYLDPYPAVQTIEGGFQKGACREMKEQGGARSRHLSQEQVTAGELNAVTCPCARQQLLRLLCGETGGASCRNTDRDQQP